MMGGDGVSGGAGRRWVTVETHLSFSAPFIARPPPSFSLAARLLLPSVYLPLTPLIPTPDVPPQRMQPSPHLPSSHPTPLLPNPPPHHPHSQKNLLAEHRKKRRTFLGGRRHKKDPSADTVEGGDVEGMRRFDAKNGWGLCAAVSPSGRRAASGGLSGAVVVSDLFATRLFLGGETILVTRLSTGPDAVSGLVWPVEERLYSASLGKTVQVWDVGERGCLTEGAGKPLAVWQKGWTPVEQDIIAIDSPLLCPDLLVAIGDQGGMDWWDARVDTRHANVMSNVLRRPWGADDSNVDCMSLHDNGCVPLHSYASISTRVMTCDRGVLTCDQNARRNITC